MTRPISGSQLKKLTRRLRDGTETPEDLHALADILIYYRQVLERAHTDVARLCAETPAHAEPMAPRVKTLRTTLQKLHRQPDLRSLAQIRDLAGLRVVVHGTRADQDDVVARIAARLPDSNRPAKIIDRRVDPRAGYRAVHLEIRREGILLEVQVRTALQHQWAELFERTADRLGRGLRYSEPVQLTTEAATFLHALDETASMIDAVEADITSTDPSVRSLATTAQKRAVHALDKANHYLEQLP
ncbi:RelA/SpoT domain-containing protein [Actinophytocola sp.]|uniref:RelA/SpoT domain-containing protein n=1 Tax=Actinophytocola sp. TaxID=1872138 RepID=UPI002ED4AB44